MTTIMEAGYLDLNSCGSYTVSHKSPWYLICPGKKDKFSSDQ